VSVKKARGKARDGEEIREKEYLEDGDKKAGGYRAGTEEHDNLVVDSAELIATGVITVAKTGQLAPAKYLFEAVGAVSSDETDVAYAGSGFAGTHAVEANGTADRTGDL
jgi:hypothetical protein